MIRIAGALDDCIGCLDEAFDGPRHGAFHDNGDPAIGWTPDETDRPRCPVSEDTDARG